MAATNLCLRYALAKCGKFVSFNFATAILKFDTFSSYHIVRTRITMVTASFSLFALSELVCTKKVFYPILLFPTFSPQASSPLERSRQTDRIEGQRKFFTPCYRSSFFFPLSARGPTRTDSWVSLWLSRHISSQYIPTSSTQFDVRG